MKKMRLILSLLLLILCIVLFYNYSQYVRYKSKYYTEVENTKTYTQLLDSTKVSNRVLKLTVEQLRSMNDSTSTILNKTIDSLKIKNKNLQRLQYIKSKANRVDTIIYRDTIFKEGVSIDTIIRDDWYKLDVNLRYPDSITISPTFVSSQSILVSSKREYVKKPHWFFLIRWFQKKHTILKVDVVEQNPYIEVKENRYIEIIDE